MTHSRVLSSASTIPRHHPHAKHPLRALHTATALISATASIALLCLTPSSHLWQDRMRAVSTARSSSWRLGISTFCELLHDVRHVGGIGRRGSRFWPQEVAVCAAMCLSDAPESHVLPCGAPSDACVVAQTVCMYYGCGMGAKQHQNSGLMSVQGS